MGGDRGGYAVKGGKKGGGGKSNGSDGKGKGGKGKSKGDRDGKGKGSKGKGNGFNTSSSSGNVPKESGQPDKIPIYDQKIAGKPIRSPKFDELPIWEHANSIKDAARNQQVFCVQGETGCGKSSVVPMLLLDAVKDARIAVTQPRRLAAISLASRVADQYGEKVGGKVGYRVGMDGKANENTKITFVTTGWLLMYLAHRESGVSRYTHIVLDEIHERDLDMDLLCLLLKKAVERHPKLCIVVMSATVNAQQFLSYFQGGGVKRVLTDPIRVGSRRFQTWPYFLDDLAAACPGLGNKAANTIQRACSRADRGGRVDVNPALFQLCVSAVDAIVKPGVCVLIFLPGLSEIEQLHEEFRTNARGSYEYHLLHSIVPHETQNLALKPPPPGKAKVILSTNIAESSITIPDVRYIFDFGVVRRLMLDDDRSMLTLVNTWASRATCMQRRGRCGRLAEGVIVYLFPRSMYNNLSEYAAPEVLNVPLETIYLKSKVLLAQLGRPEDLLAQLMDAPPTKRIQAAAQNLMDLGAIDVNGEVGALGRIAVFMPVTIQLTKLVLCAWALGCACDGVVMAAALSTQDVFKLATPQAAYRPEDFPKMLSENYIVRAWHDDGQFSEPIMYRNLYIDFLTTNLNRHQWLDRNCVSASRIQQFTSLISEIAEKFSWAVPDARNDPALKQLRNAKRGGMKDLSSMFDLTEAAYPRIKMALCGAFAPSFVLGEINFTNKNEAKIKKSGFDHTRTCLLSSIKPEEMRDEHELRKFCELLAPVSRVKLDGSKAFIECGYDTEVLTNLSTPTVKQMPLLAQLLHQLSRMPCKFPTLKASHAPAKIGSANHLNGIRWHIPGQGKIMGQPYWRSVMGYMCEMRDELKQHIGVCASLLGRDGDSVRVTGLTLLPEPGTFMGSLAVLLFASGNIKIDFVRDYEDPSSFLGVRLGFTDGEADAKPINLTFSPRRLHVSYLEKLNRARHALNQLVTTPTERIRKQFMTAVAELEKNQPDEGENDWLPYPFWCPGQESDDSSRQPGEVSNVTLIWDSVGPFQLFQVDEMSLEAQEWLQSQSSMSQGVQYEPLHASEGDGETKLAPPPWLHSLSGVALMDLRQDLGILGENFGVEVTMDRNVGFIIRGGDQERQQARQELESGILQYYTAQLGWYSSEKPVEEEASTDTGSVDDWGAPPKAEITEETSGWDCTPQIVETAEASWDAPPVATAPRGRRW